MPSTPTSPRRTRPGAIGRPSIIRSRAGDADAGRPLRLRRLQVAGPICQHRPAPGNEGQVDPGRRASRLLGLFSAELIYPDRSSTPGFRLRPETRSTLR